MKLTRSKIILLLLTLLSAPIVLVSGILIWATMHLPKLDNVQDYRPSLGSVVVDRGGHKLGEFYDTERRYLVPISDIPTHVVNSFLAAEDSNFFTHSGVDYRGMVRSFLANLKAGRFAQGGSTITQQVAKSLLLTSEKKFSRKIKEILLAYKIEKNLTKDQILFLYLNQIYFGQRSYGVESASRGYFHKSVKNLTIAESALMAGLVPAPSRYAPLNDPVKARERQEYVLRRLLDLGKITEQQQREALVERIKVYPEEDSNLGVAPYYLEHVRQVLMKKYGQDVLYEDGLNITVAADAELSQKATAAVTENLDDLDKRQGYRGALGHFTTEAEIATHLKSIRSELIFEKFGFQILPPKMGEKFQKAAWSETTLALMQEQNSEYKDERLLLDPKKKVKAVVLQIDPDGKKAQVAIGGIRGKLSVENMRWAKLLKQNEVSNGAQISRISETLKVGDLILVRPMLPLPANKEDPINVSLEQKPLAQGALLSMESNTGYVLAMVGGLDFADSKYNRAMQGERQPGSAFKAFLYSAALDKGFTPSSIIVDSPIIFENQGGSNLKWIPENNSEKFYGDTTLRTALINSRNVPAVKMLQEIGLNYFSNYLKQIGATGTYSPDLSIALGSHSISLLELTKLYSLFPRLGLKVDPVFILKVTDRDGKTVEEYSLKDYQNELLEKWTKAKEEKKPGSTKTAGATTTSENGSAPTTVVKSPDEAPGFEDPLRAMDEKTAYLMANLLQEVVLYGTGTGAKVLGRRVGGKTGTTSDFIDAWFMGFSPEVVTGVWTGFDSPRTLGRAEVGGRAALPAWIAYMQEALKKYPLDEFPVPKGIVFARIDPKTGVLASAGNSSAVKEAFVEGTEPTAERTNRQTPESNDFFREDN